MKRDSKSLTSYLEIVDQRRRYQLHTLRLTGAYPSIDTSPIPMNQSIAEKQQQNAKNRAFKFQLEEDKLKFINDIYEYNKSHRKTKKYLHSKPKSTHRRENGNNLPPQNVQTETDTLEPSSLTGIWSSQKSSISKRKYPKVVEPKTTKRTRKIPMSIQTTKYSDDPFCTSANLQNEEDQNSEKNNGYCDDYIDVPFEYSGYLQRGDYSIAVDEGAGVYMEAVNSDNGQNETEF